MCGLAGFSLSPDENINARDLSVELLLAIEPRGMDATGAAFFENGEPFVQKDPICATDFVTGLQMDPRVTNAILHTRWATKGSPKVNANNHPIDLPGILGVHNGMCSNDDALFEDIGPDKRVAQVDSEAIFATLRHSGEKPTAALGRVKGSAAVAWLDTYGDPDVLNVARISASPFHYAFSEVGSFVFASTAQAVERAMEKVGMAKVAMTHILPEGVYMRVREGDVLVRTQFATAARTTAMSATERRALNLPA